MRDTASRVGKRHSRIAYSRRGGDQHVFGCKGTQHRKQKRSPKDSLSLFLPNLPHHTSCAAPYSFRHCHSQTSPSSSFSSSSFLYLAFFLLLVLISLQTLSSPPSYGLIKEGRRASASASASASVPLFSPPIPSLLKASSHREQTERTGLSASARMPFERTVEKKTQPTYSARSPRSQ